MVTPVSRAAQSRYDVFTDCVLAFVLVRTAAGVKVNAPQDWAHLPDLAQFGREFAAYGFNGFALMVLWLNLKRLAYAAPEQPRLGLWLTLLLLAIAALTPSAAAYLAQAPLSRNGIAAFGVVWALVCLVGLARRVHLVRSFPEDGQLLALHDAVTYRSLAAMLIYLGAAPLAYVTPYAALACFVIAPALFLAPEQPRERRDSS
jgi:uncharacterized membrane protein